MFVSKELDSESMFVSNKINNKSIRKWILENCVDDKGAIDLRYIDLSGHKVYLTGMIADAIINSDQEAIVIFNDSQKAKRIHNYEQEAEEKINNELQVSVLTINNQFQKAPKIFN